MFVEAKIESTAVTIRPGTFRVTANTADPESFVRLNFKTPAEMRQLAEQILVAANEWDETNQSSDDEEDNNGDEFRPNITVTGDMGDFMRNNASTAGHHAYQCHHAGVRASSQYHDDNSTDSSDDGEYVHGLSQAL